MRDHFFVSLLILLYQAYFLLVLLHIHLSQALLELYHQHMNQTNLSLADCSVWYYAKHNSYTLLTGDRKLRNVSLLDDVEVHGIIYVIDQLVEEGILAKRLAISKIRQLGKSNP